MNKPPTDSPELPEIGFMRRYIPSTIVIYCFVSLFQCPLPQEECAEAALFYIPNAYPQPDHSA